MRNRIIIVLVAAVILTLLIGWFQIKSLRADKARLEQSAALAQTETTTLRRELAANRQALEIREKQTTELAAQTEMLRHEIEELYRNNEPCAAWADSPVPNPVLDRLRQ